MDTNQNLTNAQNQPQTPPVGSRPPVPGPAQMGATPRPNAAPSAAPRPLNPLQHRTGTPSVGAPRPATPGAPSAAPNARPNTAAPVPGARPNPATPASGVSANSFSRPAPSPAPNPAASPTSNPTPNPTSGAPARHNPLGSLLHTSTNTSAGNPTGSSTTSPAGTPASVNPSANPSASAPANSPNNATPIKKGLSKKTLYIIIGCVAAVVVVACIIFAVISLAPSNEPTPAPAPNPGPSQVETPAAKTAIEELDQDGLLAAFDEMQEEGYAPDEDYVNAAVVSYSDNYGGRLMLADSYADVEELSEREFYDGNYTVNIDQVDDTFAIITASDESGNPVPDAYAYIAFDANYLVYDSSATIGDAAGGSEATADSGVEPYTFIDTSEAFVKKALPVLHLTLTSGGMPLSSVYDYSYNVSDETIDLNLDSIYVGISYDDEAGTDTGSYVIESAYTELSVDITTGVVTCTTFDAENNTFETVIDSYPLTEDEGLERYELQLQNYHISE